MKPGRLIPEPLRPMFQPIYQWLRKATWRPGDLSSFHAYWTLPNDGLNRPCDYINEYMTHRSKLLVELVGKYAEPAATILEIGGGVGRNLAFLYEAGYRNLETVELSPQAIDSFHGSFPEAARATKIHHTTIEEIIGSFPDNHFDVVVTMTTLQHIHPKSQWVFPHIVRIARRHLMTIENEQKLTWRHVPRDYRKVFEGLGLKQLEVIPCQSHGMSGENIARVFAKGSPAA